MQENRNKYLLISLVGLTCATVATWFFLNSGDAEVIVDKQIFKVNNLDEIDRIELKSASQTVDLKFNGSRWLVNEKYPAEARMIDVLFATLKQTEPKRPVGSAVRDSLSQMLKSAGVHVSLYQGANVVKEFFVGGNEAKTQSYFLDQASGEVYVMNIPGYRVYVSGIFELGESGYRDKYVFAFNWRNFKSIRAEFPSNLKENFVVALNKDYFTIQGMTDVDTSKLNTFLDRVSLLTVDQYVSRESLIDSLNRSNPVMKITVEDIAKRTYQLNLFTSSESETVAGLVGQQAVLFDPARIRPILLPKSFFSKR
jgi:hypothetical protein